MESIATVLRQVARALNSLTMPSEELITKHAETVLVRDPGIPGQAPRVWAYRNTTNALNWYSPVREKLDDPRYASWFIKFNGFSSAGGFPIRHTWKA